MSVEATFFMRVYNVDEWLLRRAVESVLKQTESNFRFIIQDNGTTDDSKEILEEYANNDNRIEIFRNEVNSIATYEEWLQREEVIYRNFEGCGSKYFAFIDSDDYYESNFLKKALDIAKNEKADIVFAGYRQITLEGVETACKLPEKMSGEIWNLPEYWLEKNYFSLRTLWGNLYSGKFWRDYWKFLDVERPDYMKNGIDTYIVLSIVKNSERIAFLDKVMYTQTIRINSIYKTDFRADRVLEAEILFLKGIELAHSVQNLNEKTVTFLATVYYYHIEDIMYGLIKNGDKQLLFQAMKLLEDGQVFNMLITKNVDLQKLRQIIYKELEYEK